jgi:DNA-binding NarL/FixJ family response regulator
VDHRFRARSSLKALLSTWHRAVGILEAGGGREALHLMREFQPDMVLMEACMPEVDGLEATMQIKATWPEVKVIVLSMYAEYHDEALAAGADAFVRKGDAPGALLDLLSVVLEKEA